MKYTAYDVRKSTDAFFTPDMGNVKFSGRFDRLIKFVEKSELLDPKLWTLFVDQFRLGNADDGDIGWRGEFWGKMMRGACFTYAYTQNEELYAVLESTVRDLLYTQDGYGRIATYSFLKEFSGWDMWCRKYVLLGLQYFLEICRDDGLADSIVDAMKRHADYIMAKIGNDEIGKIPVTNTSAHWQGMNSSSILEPFVRLYHITKEKKYLDFASSIIDAGGMKHFDLYKAALEGKLYPYQYPVTKAYEMMSNFEGILEYYRAAGDEKYKTMAVNFARLVIDSDVTVIGSCGMTHELFDHSRVTQFDPSYTLIAQETCVTVTWIKFCHQLLCLTGDPIYADEIERSVYNCLDGSINVNANKAKYGFSGNTIPEQTYAFDSYSPLLNSCRGRAVGGRMDIIKNDFWWGCCVAIGAAGTGLIGMTAVMPASGGNVAVNLYAKGKSRVVFDDGSDAVFDFETSYPVEGNVKITLSLPEERRFAVLFRIPSWSRETVVSVNGSSHKTNAKGIYYTVLRNWKNGDTVELSFDMRTEIVYASSLDPSVNEESVCHLSLRRGPIVLARDSRTGEDVTEAVTVTDDNGFAVVSPCGDVAFAHEQAYKVKTADGDITVVDYASCGQEWGKPMTVWITTK